MKSRACQTPIGRVAIAALYIPYMSTVHARISTRGWSLESLVQTSPNFRKVDRVSANVEDIFSVLRNYELRGVPLVIEDFHKHESWPSEMFTLENFAKNSESTGMSLSNCDALDTPYFNNTRYQCTKCTHLDR
jgi:hypothetical protein